MAVFGNDDLVPAYSQNHLIAFMGYAAALKREYGDIGRANNRKITACLLSWVLLTCNVLQNVSAVNTEPDSADRAD